jgi:hypothetical protein
MFRLSGWHIVNKCKFKITNGLPYWAPVVAVIMCVMLSRKKSVNVTRIVQVRFKLRISILSLSYHHERCMNHYHHENDDNPRSSVRSLFFFSVSMAADHCFNGKADSFLRLLFLKLLLQIGFYFLHCIVTAKANFNQGLT